MGGEWQTIEKKDHDNAVGAEAGAAELLALLPWPAKRFFNTSYIASAPATPASAAASKKR